MRITKISLVWSLLLFGFVQNISAQTGSKTTGTKSGVAKTPVAPKCTIKCKGEIIPDMDCYITYNGKKSPLIKGGRKYNLILLCSETKIEAELVSTVMPIPPAPGAKPKPAGVPATAAKPEKGLGIMLIKYVTVEDTMPMSIKLEFLGKDKFIDYIRDNNKEMVANTIKTHPEFPNNKYNDFDIMPLAIACERGNTEIAKILIEGGADVNAKSEWSLPPICSTVIDNKFDTFKLLIDKGADLNAKDQGGWTPLHFAAYEGKTEYFNLLIAKGADFNAKTLKGETPLKLAMAKAHLGLADALREKGAKEDEQE